MATWIIDDSNGHIDNKENNPYLDSHFLKAKGDDSHEIILTQM
jgi:hypothetical protein